MSETVDAVYERCKFLRGKGRGAEKALLLLPAEEAKKRIANDGPKPKTRLIKEMHTAEAYSSWNAEFDRWVQAVGDPNIAYDLMLRCLQEVSSEAIAVMAAEG